jgi:hypothetical protein
MKKRPSQQDRILALLERGRGITPIQALNKFGCFRLSARIKQLRNQGHAIETKQVSVDGKKFARYSLIKS